jgi:hypothetical protein
VIPGAVDAHLDHVARELVVAACELLEPPVRVDDAPVEVLEVVTVDVAHPPESLVRAHRAAGPDLLSDVTRGPQELGVRVTDIVGVEVPAPERLNSHAPGQAVVDRRPREARGPVGIERAPSH